LLIPAFAWALLPMTSPDAKQIHDDFADLETPVQMSPAPIWTPETQPLDNEFTDDPEDSDDVDSNAQNTMDVSTEKQLSFVHRNRADNLNIQTHLTANYRPLAAPVKDPAAGPVTSGEHELQVSSFYLAATDPKHTVSARIGRQSFDMVGTPYQFDGFALSYRLFNRQQIKMVAGYPQAGASPADINTDNFFYGVSAESNRFAKFWRADVYAFEHIDDGTTGRQVMGSKINYLHPRHSAMLGFDLNPNNDGPSSAYAIFDWHPRDHYSLKISLDYRKPDALKEHSISALDELLKSMTDEEIKLLEQDPTAEFKAGTLAWRKKLNHKLSLNGETSIATLYTSPVNGSGRTETHRLYSLQLTGNGLVKTDDTSSLSVRFFDFEAANRLSLAVNNRMPFRRSWQADIELEADWQENEDRSKILSLGPLFRLQYNKKDKTKLEFEIGVKRSEFFNRADQTLENDYFFNITHSREL
jgi:hypothetical protein